MSGVESCYIRLQRERVKKHQREIVDQLITKSRYAVMDRNDRRTFEYYADEISQLKAQAKDLKKAKVVADRIGVVLERLRKELNAIKQHLTDYDFVSTDGSDMQDASNSVDVAAGGYSATTSACDCPADLSMDSANRHIWIEKAKTMITCLRNFSLAQRLGNYSLLWNANSTVGDAAGDSTLVSVLDGGSGGGPASDDCHTLSGDACLVYRPEFLYMQHVTTCRTVPKAYEDELDTDATNNYTDASTNSPDFAPGGTGEIPLDQGSSKKYHNYFSISNPDLKVHDLWEELVCGTNRMPSDGVNASAATIFLDQIDDERDVTCVLRLIIEKTDHVMNAQQDNDNEQAALECACEVNEQNMCWFQGVAAELSEIDEDELKQKHHNGEQILTDLADLFRKSSNKKDYFSAIELTSKGASWF